MFDKILIANRGEIAGRVIRTCRNLNIRTVAVYSEADSRMPCVEKADETAFIGPAPAVESYLVKERIIEAAQQHGCQAVHPGYGFLSENPEFARMAIDHGLVFIGPPPEAMRLLGDKVVSKALAQEVGIPVVPAHPEPLADVEHALAVARDMGYPLLLKPAAGGGGRGMRVVSTADELRSAFPACQDEAAKGFGDDRVFVERFISRPRHIEFQIMADEQGRVIHLGERECSIQRRYQKVLEESPSLVLDEDLRREMGAKSCELARAAGYVNAGTVEFILDQDRNFYFLEMNTRLQVEHPVTEMVTGLDLMEMQFRIASGHPLPLNQEDVVLSGWAIEARICAEDPFRDFFPTTGIVTRYAVPRGVGIRVDDGIAAGTMVTIHYDSLLAKIIAHGQDREEARQRLVRALNGYHIEGLTTNVDFVNALADHPAFAAGELSTDFIPEHFDGGRSKQSPDTTKVDFMVMAATLVFHNRQALVRQSLSPLSPLVGTTRTRFQSMQYMVKAEDEVCRVQLEKRPEEGKWRITVNDRSYEVVTPEFEFYRRRLRLKIDGESHMFRLKFEENHNLVFFCGIVLFLEVYTPLEWQLNQYMIRTRPVQEEDVLRCPMPGLVVDVSVQPGDVVRKGQELFKIEAMKMQSSIASPRDSLVEKVFVAAGQTVAQDEDLLQFQEGSGAHMARLDPE